MGFLFAIDGNIENVNFAVNFLIQTVTVFSMIGIVSGLLLSVRFLKVLKAFQ